MQADIKVSVIVPFYRAKQHLDNIVRVLQSQTLKEMEFLLVDDCSGDGSYEYACEITSCDSRFIILQNPQRRGPGCARNLGIENARGEYIGFVDADDAVSSDYYELLYKKASSTGVLVAKGQCVRILPGGKEEKSPLNPSLKKALAEKKHLLNAFHYEHWNCIYNRSFVNKIQARYGACAQGEDAIFLMKVMCNLPPEMFVLEEKAIYYYDRTSPASLYNNLNKDFLKHSADSLRLRLEYLATQPDSEHVRNYVSGQFEEKIITRTKRVWDSFLISRSDILDYLTEVMSIAKPWVESRQSNHYGTYLQLAEKTHFSASRLLELISDEMRLAECRSEIKKALQSFSPALPEASNADLERKMSLLANADVVIRLYHKAKWRAFFSCGKKKLANKAEVEKLRTQVREIREMRRKLIDA